MLIVLEFADRGHYGTKHLMQSSQRGLEALPDNPDRHGSVLFRKDTVTKWPFEINALICGI